MGQIKNIKLHIVTDIKTKTTMSFIRHFRTLSALCTKNVTAEHSLHRVIAPPTWFTPTQIRNYTTGEEDDSLQENPFYAKYEDKIKKLKDSGVYEPPNEYYNKALMREAKEWKEKIQKNGEETNGKKDCRFETSRQVGRFDAHRSSWRGEHRGRGTR